MPRRKRRTHKLNPYKSKSHIITLPQDGQRTRRRRSPSLQLQERQRREQERRERHLQERREIQLRLQERQRREQEIRIARQLENEENNRILRDIAESFIRNGIIKTAEDIDDEEMTLVKCDDENVFDIIRKYYIGREISRDEIHILTDWIEHKTEEVINPDRLRQFYLRPRRY